MQFQLPDPNEFGQGDALACLTIWLVGILCVLVFGVDWYQKGSPDWFIGLLSIGGITTPFGLMLYKANEKLKYEDRKKI